MSDIDAYVAALPVLRRERGEALHRLLCARFPQAEQSLLYRMPTYRLEGGFLAWSNQKRYLSIYTCSALRVAAFKKRFPAIPGGVGCLNFRDGDEFPLAALGAVLRCALSPSAALLGRERKAAREARDARTQRRPR